MTPRVVRTLGMVILSLGAFLFHPAKGAEVGLASELLLQCEDRDLTTGAFCLSYVRGVWDGAISFANISNVENSLCPHGPVIADQMRRVFIGWGNRYPQYLSWPAGLAVLQAYREAFPCGATSPVPERSRSKKPVRQ